GDAVGEPAVALQRVRAAYALEPADQHLVVRVDEHHLGREAALGQLADGAGQVGGEDVAAHVQHHGGAPDRRTGPLGQLGQVQQERLGQVVHHVEPDVLQGPGHRAAAATGDPGD